MCFGVRSGRANKTNASNKNVPFPSHRAIRTTCLLLITATVSGVLVALLQHVVSVSRRLENRTSNGRHCAMRTMHGTFLSLLRRDRIRIVSFIFTNYFRLESRRVLTQLNEKLEIQTTLTKCTPTGNKTNLKIFHPQHNLNLR